jgi:hypothetical protein
MSLTIPKLCLNALYFQCLSYKAPHNIQLLCQKLHTTFLSVTYGVHLNIRGPSYPSSKQAFHNYTTHLSYQPDSHPYYKCWEDRSCVFNTAALAAIIGEVRH